MVSATEPTLMGASRHLLVNINIILCTLMKKSKNTTNKLLQQLHYLTVLKYETII